MWLRSVESETGDSVRRRLREMTVAVKLPWLPLTAAQPFGLGGPVVMMDRGI